MAVKTLPRALFDTLANLSEDTPSCIKNLIAEINIKNAEQEYHLSREFLLSYAASADTFNTYRKEVERFLQWSWLVCGKPLRDIDRHDIRNYLSFIENPPVNWISTKSVRRFITKNGERQHNTDWRPFVLRTPKSQSKQGIKLETQSFRLSNSSLEALFAGLSTYFTFLQQEMYLEINPIQLVRQKSRFIRKQQSLKVTRRLSNLQWDYTINAIEAIAATDTQYERHLFILSAFYLLGLRISELAETPGRIPCMGDFAPDKHDRWWFTTVGKGNKLRDVAVPDAMLSALKRYRTYLGLSPLPSRGETTPLIHKQRGHGGLGTRQIRNLVQTCFDLATQQLKQDGQQDAADDLAAATVHWLRHTAISADVEHRPREHVRDDAGHENASITDRYIDADRIARHNSAKHKQLKPTQPNMERIED